MSQTPPGSMGAPFVGFARRYDVAWPEQDATPGGGGVGPLPKSGLRVTITPRKA